MNTWCLFCLWDRREASILTRTEHTGCLTLEFHPLELGGVNNPVHSTCVAAWLVKTQVLKANPLVYLHLFPHLQSQNDRMVMAWCCLQTKWSDNKYATCSWFDRAIPSMTGLHGHQSSSFQTGSLSIPRPFPIFMHGSMSSPLLQHCTWRLWKMYLDSWVPGCCWLD